MEVITKLRSSRCTSITLMENDSHSLMQKNEATHTTPEYIGDKSSQCNERMLKCKHLHPQGSRISLAAINKGKSITDKCQIYNWNEKKKKHYCCDESGKTVYGSKNNQLLQTSTVNYKRKAKTLEYTGMEKTLTA